MIGEKSTFNQTWKSRVGFRDQTNISSAHKGLEGDLETAEESIAWSFQIKNMSFLSNLKG